jgi:hypothetical protein
MQHAHHIIALLCLGGLCAVRMRYACVRLRAGHGANTVATRVRIPGMIDRVGWGPRWWQRGRPADPRKRTSVVLIVAAKPRHGISYACMTNLYLKLWD